jgi:hypothetical protein
MSYWVPVETLEHIFLLSKTVKYIEMLPGTFPLLGNDYVVSVSVTVTQGIFAMAMIFSVEYNEFNFEKFLTQAFLVLPQSRL